MTDQASAPLEPLVSIIMPHFETADLARLCLRSIRKYTTQIPYEVVVIDNNSQDAESLVYLRSVDWIRLIERKENVGRVAKGHREAVDMGIEATTAPLILTIHTDTIPIRDDWLEWHVDQMADPHVAAVGTYKLELKSSMRRWLKLFEFRRGSQNGQHYIRSHCAMYRRRTLDALRLRYNDPAGDSTGKQIHSTLEENGYEARLLDVEEALQRVVHLNHATMALRPELGAGQRCIRQGLSRIHRFLAQPKIQAILNDESLDRGTAPVSQRAA